MATMVLGEAYLRLCGAVLLAGCVAAHAEDRSANQVLLAPGASMTFSDAANPGINVVVTAPADSYLNLSRLAAASEKHGIYAITTTVQVKAAGAIVSNADGSLSLRPASEQSIFVPKDAAPAPGRITLEGGTALLNRGQVFIHSDRVVNSGAQVPAARPAVNATPPVIPAQPSGMLRATAAPAPVPTPGIAVTTGTATLNTTATPSTITFGSFNVGTGTGVTVTQGGGVTTLQSAQGGNINITGNLSNAGNVVIINPGGYSHTSVALHDAVKAIATPVIEVHLSDPETRESFRHTDLVALAATQLIKGEGARGYSLALDVAARL